MHLVAFLLHGEVLLMGIGREALPVLVIHRVFLKAFHLLFFVRLRPKKTTFSHSLHLTS